MNWINKLRLLLGIPLDSEIRLDPDTYNFYTRIAGASNKTLEEWVESVLDQASEDFKDPPPPEEPTLLQPFTDDRHPCKWWTGTYVGWDQRVACGHPENGNRPCNWSGTVAKQCPLFSIRKSWIGKI